MSKQIADAVNVLLAEARRLHNAPDAAASDFTFRLRPDRTGIDCFRNWQGVTIPFNAED